MSAHPTRRTLSGNQLGLLATYDPAQSAPSGASEKAEIIELVEQSHLPAKRTLGKLGIPRATFYRCYDRYSKGGVEALADHRSRPDRVWNRIPNDVRGQIIDLALELPELSPRELAVRFTDQRKYLSRRLQSGAMSAR